MTFGVGRKQGEVESVFAKAKSNAMRLEQMSLPRTLPQTACRVGPIRRKVRGKVVQDLDSISFYYGQVFH